jgi:hypothetical protein
VSVCACVRVWRVLLSLRGQCDKKDLMFLLCVYVRMHVIVLSVCVRSPQVGVLMSAAILCYDLLPSSHMLTLWKLTADCVRTIPNLTHHMYLISRQMSEHVHHSRQMCQNDPKTHTHRTYLNSRTYFSSDVGKVRRVLRLKIQGKVTKGRFQGEAKRDCWQCRPHPQHTSLYDLAS